MSEKSSDLASISGLRRSAIDHIVLTLSAGVITAFFFLCWHLYSQLSQRVTDLEKEHTAAIVVLKENTIVHKVRLDILDQTWSTRKAEPTSTVASIPAQKPTDSTLGIPESPMPVPQQRPNLLNSALNSVEDARDGLNKRIQDSKQQIKK